MGIPPILAQKGRGVAGITATIRGRGRQSIRAARRVAGGTAGLGPKATVGWVWSRRPGASGTSDEPENTSFTWVTASEAMTTRAFVHNYWSDAYSIERPVFDAALVDEVGRRLYQWSFVLEPDGTEVIDVRALCRQAEIPLPFAGQLFLRLRDERLIAGRPVQHYADYACDDGEISGVHGQYGLMSLPLAQGVGSMRVQSSAGTRTAIVVQNAYAGPGAPTSMRVPIDVFSYDGRVRRAEVGPLAAGASRTVMLDEIFPDLEAFLGGRAGHFRAQLPCPSSRLLSYVTFDPHERLVVNHGTVDRILQQDPGLPPEWTVSRPMLSMFALCDGERDAVISLPNLWGPIAADYVAVIELFDTEGVRIASRRVPVVRGGLEEVSVRAMLVEAGEREPFVGNAQVVVEPVGRLVELPMVIDGLVGVVEQGQLRGEVQVGSEFHNADVPPQSRHPDIRRTRVFGRVDISDGKRVWLHLAYPVAGDATLPESATTLTLLDPNGERLVREVVIRPRGSLFAPLEELFPDARALLGTAGVGAIRVRDTTARLYGYVAVESSGRSLAIDHLTGG